MRAAELIAVIVKQQVEEACKDAWMQHNTALTQSAASLSKAQEERDRAVRAYDHVLAQRNVSRFDCDAARAELAGVAAQRDAYLSRSVELATRVTELEAKTFDLARLEQDNAGLRSALASEARKTFDMHARVTELESRLAAAAPAEAAEVDGFRVGDLVGFFLNPPPQQFGVVERVDEWVKVKFPSHYVAAYKPHQLARKPVEVGDTVRVVGGGSRAGRIDAVICGEAHVVTEPGERLGEAYWVILSRLVAVAP
jgi:multidrug efflux pump subunit AcrA (membrane-fusion protein)